MISSIIYGKSTSDKIIKNSIMAESYLKLAKVYSLLGSKYLGLNV